MNNKNSDKRLEKKFFVNCGSEVKLWSFEVEDVKSFLHQELDRARKESLKEGAYAFLRYYIQGEIVGMSGAGALYRRLQSLLKDFDKRYITEHTK